MAMRSRSSRRRSARSRPGIFPGPIRLALIVVPAIAITELERTEAHCASKIGLSMSMARQDQFARDGCGPCYPQSQDARAGGRAAGAAGTCRPTFPQETSRRRSCAQERWPPSVCFQVFITYCSCRADGRDDRQPSRRSPGVLPPESPRPRGSSGTLTPNRKPESLIRGRGAWACGEHKQETPPASRVPAIPPTRTQRTGCPEPPDRSQTGVPTWSRRSGAGSTPPAAQARHHASVCVSAPCRGPASKPLPSQSSSLAKEALGDMSKTTACWNVPCCPVAENSASMRHCLRLSGV